MHALFKRSDQGGNITSYSFLWFIAGNKFHRYQVIQILVLHCCTKHDSTIEQKALKLEPPTICYKFLCTELFVKVSFDWLGGCQIPLSILWSKVQIPPLAKFFVSGFIHCRPRKSYNMGEKNQKSSVTCVLSLI